MRHSKSEFLLGTTVEVSVISNHPDADAHVSGILGFFREFESEFSRFRPDSSLSRLNASMSERVSDRFIRLLELCEEAYSVSGGRFNPLADVSRIGYSRTFDSGTFVPVRRTLYDVDFAAVRTEGNLVTLREGQFLDFGGIGKGYAAALAALRLASLGHANFFINAGGDIFARGTNGKDPGWRIGIENPFTGNVLASVCVRDMAVTTSGSYKRRWELEGKSYHHIIRPETAENPDSVVSVTLVGENAALCDAFTKAVFNLPAQDGLAFVRKNGMDGLVITGEGEIFHTAGMLKEYSLAFA